MLRSKKYKEEELEQAITAIQEFLDSKRNLIQEMKEAIRELEENKIKMSEGHSTVNWTRHLKNQTVCICTKS